MAGLLQALFWLGLVAVVVAGLCANAADTMAEQERRQGLADRDGPALVKIKVVGVPIGRYLHIPSLYSDWYSAYQSPLIRQLTHVARIGLWLGLLVPATLFAAYVGIGAS